MKPDHEHAPPGKPCIECFRQWLEYLDERENVRISRLEKLVTKGHSIEWLIRESHHRRNLRHERRSIQMVRGWIRNGMYGDVRPDLVVTAPDCNLTVFVIPRGV